MHTHRPALVDIPKPGVARIGIGGPVGSGKAALKKALVSRLLTAGHHPSWSPTTSSLPRTPSTSRRYSPAYSLLNASLAWRPARVRIPRSVTTPVCLDAITGLHRRFPEADVVLVESGGDNLAPTFSRALAYYYIFVIDVAEGYKIPRKRGPGVTASDLLVINKIDLAPYVRASLDVKRRDARAVRGNRPFVLTNCFTGDGLGGVTDRIKQVIRRRQGNSAA